jgi:hypothetical protein
MVLKIGPAIVKHSSSGSNMFSLASASSSSRGLVLAPLLLPHLHPHRLCINVQEGSQTPLFGKFHVSRLFNWYIMNFNGILSWKPFIVFF